MTPEKIAEWAEAKQWLKYALRDLDQALNFCDSDDKWDINARDANFKASIRSLEEACALLGMEVIIPSLEEKL
jgi:hypothetical protein